MFKSSTLGNTNLSLYDVYEEAAKDEDGDGVLEWATVVEAPKAVVQPAQKAWSRLLAQYSAVHLVAQPLEPLVAGILCARVEVVGTATIVPILHGSNLQDEEVGIFSGMGYGSILRC